MTQIMTQEIKLDFFGKFNLISIMALCAFSSALLLQTDKCPTLSKHAKKILLAPKPAPILDSIARGMIYISNEFDRYFSFRRS